MISRKATVLIQQLYEELFCADPANLGTPYLETDKLYYFLYEDNHEGWFLDIYRRRIATAAQLRDFILGLHTGMAYTSRTQDMDQKRTTGQRLLKHLAVSVLKMLEPDFDSPTAANNPDVVMGKALVNL